MINAFSSWGIDKLGFDIIWGIVHFKNQPSIKILENVGFKYIDSEKERLRYKLFKRFSKKVFAIFLKKVFEFK